MRTLRLSVLGTVILALLGGLGGVVAAQDEAADPMAPAVVTGTRWALGIVATPDIPGAADAPSPPTTPPTQQVTRGRATDE